jgi:myo-inositol 2-dehydrogenase/D-chiro-inositol 1-dehydrogenase
VAEVYAAGAVRETAWFARYGDVDTAAALLRLTDGALAVVTGARHDPLGYDARLEVFGTEDSVTAGGGPRSPLRSLEPAEPAPRGPPYRDFLDRFEAAYRSELAAFVAAIGNGGSSPVGLVEARAALVIALAADRSRAERRPVSIQEVARA